MRFIGMAAMVLIVALVGCSGTEEAPSPTRDVDAAVETMVAQALPTATPTEDSRYRRYGRGTDGGDDGRYPAYADSRAHACSSAHARANAHACTYSNPDSYGNPYARVHGYTCAHTCPNRHPDPRPYANPDPHTHAYSDPHTQPDTPAHGHHATAGVDIHVQGI